METNENKEIQPLQHEQTELIAQPKKGKPKVDLFPGSIEVYKLERGEDGDPLKYITIQVPEELAEEQLNKPKAERMSHWKDLTFKKDADKRYLA